MGASGLAYPHYTTASLKPKDLVGLPWRVAFALQEDGWYLRSDIIWAKPNPMPESVRDRPTKSHEYLFLLSKRPRYYYNAEAIKEPLATDPKENYPARAKVTGRGRQEAHGQHPSGAQQDASGGYPPNGEGRNRRDVWTIPTSPYKGAHFATFPPDLVEPCVLAGCPEGGIVLDPFCGSGMVGEVCQRLNRRFVGLDLSYAYLNELALPRLLAAPVAML
jgi:DNA modification methylase